MHINSFTEYKGEYRKRAGEIRKLSSETNAKKQRKAIEWERLEDFSRKLKIPREKKKKDTKGIFQAKMGTIKDKNGMDLTEAEDIKKRWQEYTEDLQKRSS